MKSQLVSSDTGSYRARYLARPLLALLALAAVTLLAIGCGGESSTEANTDRFRVGSTQEVDSLNPYVAVSSLSDSATNLVYPTLVTFDESVTEIVGDFAKSWEMSDDGRTITFETHEGEWSDGEPLTAEDAAWTINMTLEHVDGPTGAHAGYVQGIERAEATDATTLVVRYQAPVTGALERLQRIRILPEQVWGEHAAGDGSGISRFAPKPPMVVGGPFELERFDPQGVTLLTRNESYYGEEPAVGTVGFQTYSSPDALLAALANGEIDAIDAVPANISLGPIDDSPAVIGKDDGTAIEWLMINSNPKKPEHRELLDRDVRAALNQAIDREEIVEVAWRGNAQPGAAMLPVSNRFHPDGVEPPPFDPEAANRALDELGYERGPDGIRVANGAKMSYEVPSSDTSNTRAFEIVKQGWEQIGVEVTQRLLDFPGMVEAIGAPDGETLDYDIALWGYTSSPEPTSILSLPTCAQRGAFNEPYYCNREYDRLFDEQARTLDEEARGRLIDQMQEILVRDLPYLVLSYQDAISVHAEGWENLVMSPYGFINGRLTKLPFIRVSP